MSATGPNVPHARCPPGPYAHDALPSGTDDVAPVGTQVGSDMGRADLPWRDARGEHGSHDIDHDPTMTDRTRDP